MLGYPYHSLTIDHATHSHGKPRHHDAKNLNSCGPSSADLMYRRASAVACSLTCVQFEPEEGVVAGDGKPTSIIEDIAPNCYAL